MQMLVQALYRTALEGRDPQVIEGIYVKSARSVPFIISMVLAVGIASLNSAHAQNAVQGRRDFARIHALNAETQSSLRNRAEEAARDARSVVDGSRIDCDVTHARLIGYTRRDKPLLEVACRKSAGFIVDTSTMSPRAFDCRILAAGAVEARAAGRKVPSNAVCSLPENASN